MNQEMPKFVSEPAESFGVDFGTARSLEIQNAISKVAGFSFRGSEASNTQVTYRFERQNGDGTTMEIVIKKGEKYKSPAELKKLEEEVAAKAAIK